MIDEDIVNDLDTTAFKKKKIDLMMPNKRNQSEFISNKQLLSDLNQNDVKKALRARGSLGATSSEISEITKLSQPVVRKHLESLCATREAYKLKRGKQLTIYYINGKPRHDYGIEKIESGDLLFEICLAEGHDEKIFLHIIEKRITLLEGERIDGGVIIPQDLLLQLIDKLKKFQNTLEENE